MNLELAMAGAIPILAGIAVLRLLAPRPGRPESRWLSTETNALLAAVLILILLVSGAGMVARGLLAQ